MMNIINYNKFKYSHIINFYKLCFINQNEIKTYKNIRLLIIQGIFNEENITKEDFFIFYKYEKNEIIAAIDFFSSLDIDYITNQK